MPVRLVSQEELPGPLRGYRLIERLGRGGFGEVWKVEAPGGLLKAAKFVFGDLDAMDEDSRPAEQELKALKRVREIRHPYILSLERFDQIDGQLIIVMELADRNLWDRFRECKSQGLQGVPRDELLRYLEEAAEALDLMNSHYQIQHLDIKPQNLFLVFNHVKVGDFGLAKLLEGVRATVTGGVTPVYAAPETFEGWVSRFSDQYSLAIVFQELLTASRPFNGINTRQLLMQHINGTPELGALPLADRPIIARGLSKKPDDRWPTCAEMIRALKLAGVTTPVITPGPQTGSGTVGRDSPPFSPRPGPANPSNPDSVMATRMAMGGSGRLGPDPSANTAKTQTPQPGGLPPLIKPTGAAGNCTPMPTGAGPRLVTPNNFGMPAPANTVQRASIFQTGRMGSLGIALPEKNGDGVLFPALLVGLGQTGRRLLESFKSLVRDRYDNLDKLPSIRCLYLDTDPEVFERQADDSPLLAPREILPVRLNRPAHYLQRDSVPNIDQWMPTGLLYKLARTPGAANGVRAFGRLAFFDNYRSVVQRLRQEIESFLTEEPLNQSLKHTNLGFRSNRPRVYILSGLAGGTGGGIFLDLAFLLRHELRQVGYLKPELVGHFLVPPAAKNSARNAALGNTFAALTELHHFQAKQTRYQASFEKGEAPVIDSEPPFARVSLTELPKAPSAKEQAEASGRVARSLFQELLTPAGRVADEVRDVYRNAFPSAVPSAQTFGLFRLSWPRPEVLAAATRRFAQRQIQRWTAKDAAQLREPIFGWLAQQWEERNLTLDSMVEALHASVRNVLGEDPDRVFDSYIKPLRTRPGGGSRGEPTTPATVFEELIKLIGKPESDKDPMPGSLDITLKAEYERLNKETESHLSVMAAFFLDVPQFRLPGAEEAVRQISEKLKQQVETLEPVRRDLDKEVRLAYGRLLQALSSTLPGSGVVARKPASTELLDLLRTYPRKRLQLHILDLCLAVYKKLQGNAPEFLREINFCRASLADMHAALGNAAPQLKESRGLSKLILPDGCKDLDAGADQFLAGLAPEDLLAFEQSLQKEMAKKFRGLGSICLKPAEKGPAFRELLLLRAREFLDRKLDHSDPATVFFRYRPDEQVSEPLVAEAFDDATPELALPNGEKPYEINILGTPPGPAGERFRQLAARVLTNVELTAAPLPDDICFYREYPQIELSTVLQLGEFAREAYQQMSADNPPHARVDVPWQMAAEPAQPKS